MEGGRPLWLDEPYEPRPPLRGSATCDVAIVGGGMTGASLAWFLGGQGLRVVLLEADEVASRASGRNAGFVISTIAEPYASLAARRGRGVARTLWAVQRDNRERVAGLVQELALDCGFERTGSFQAAGSEAEAAALRGSAAMLRGDGFDFRFLEPGEAKALLGRAGRRGALHGPRDGQIHPARFVRGLAARAAERGVRIHERSRVEALERPDAKGPWLLRGEGFRLDAPRVVLAANALAPALHPWFGDKLVPVRGQCLATAPLPGARVPGPVYADRGYDYWRLHEGRVVLGGRRLVAEQEEVGLEEALNARVQGALDALLRDLFPGAAARVTHRWAGIMDFSVDGFPLVGPVPGEEGLLTAVGFTGHGFGYCCLAAEWLAGLVLRGKDEVPGPLRSGRELRAELLPR